MSKDVSLLAQLAAAQLWQSVAVAAALALVLILTRRASGAARYAMASAAFVAAAVLPLLALIPGEGVLAALLKATRAPITLAAAPAAETPSPADAVARPSQPSGAEDASSVELAAEPGGRALADVGRAQGAEAPASGAADFSWLKVDWPALEIAPVFLLIWGAGALVLALRTACDLFAAERLVREARPAVLPPALARRMQGVRVLVSPAAPGPMAAGLLKPSVVLPETGDSLVLGAGGEALLEHERAHIERGDTIVAVAQRLLLALLWWSPAMHWISRRMDEERELACDETAVARTGDARAFARSLTEQAESQLWRRAPRLAVGAIGPRSQFAARVRRLIETRRAAPAGVVRAGFAALVFAGVAAACLTPALRADADGPGPQADRAPDLAGGLAFNDSPAPPEHPAAPHPPEPPAPPAWPLPPEAFSEAFRQAFADLDGEHPELEAELAALAAEMALLGSELSASVSQEVMAEMPHIMAEVQAALAEADMERLEDREEVRAALEAARIELERELGDEFRSDVRAALSDARSELRAGREELRAAIRAAGEEHGESHAWRSEYAAAIADAIAMAREAGDRARSRQAEGLDGATLDAGGHVDALNLAEAAGEGELGEMRRLLDRGADPNTTDRSGRTALMAAVEGGEVAALSILVKAGADANRSGVPGRTPLMRAVRDGEVAIVDMLLDAGADPNARDASGDTPLMEAIEGGETAIASRLVKAGADVNASVREHGATVTPLMAAEEAGEDAIVGVLRAAGARR